MNKEELEKLLSDINSYSNRKINRALENASEGYRLSLELNEVDLATNFLSTINYCHRVKGQIKTAEKLHDEHQKRFRKNHSEAWVKFLSYGGVIKRRLGKLDDALRYFEDALSIAEQIGNEEIYQSVILNYSSLLVQEKKFAEAYYYLNRAYDFFLRNKNHLRCTICKNNLAIIYGELNSPNQAIDEYLQAISHFRQFEDPQINIFIQIHSNLAYILIQEGRTDEAMDCLNISLETLKGQNIPSLELYPKVNLSEILLQKGKNKEALATIEGIFQEALASEEIKLRIDAILCYVKCLHKNRKWEEAIDVIKKHRPFFEQHQELNKLRIILKIKYEILKGKYLHTELIQLMDEILSMEEGIQKANEENKVKNLNMLLELKSIEQKLQYQKDLNQKNEEINQALRQKNEYLDQFVSIAAHDLRAPIRTIGGFGNFLKKKGELDHEYLNFILKASDQMKTLLDDLLEFSKIGTSELNNEKFDVAEIISNITSLLKFQIEKKKAVIEYESLPSIYGDKGLLQILFQNLIQNALKYVDKNISPIIRISSKSTPSGTIISVRDNGTGIPEKDLDKIFEPFIRSANHAKFDGSGIGLATCMKIIKAHKGKLTVESEIGKGSIFNVILKNN